MKPPKGHNTADSHPAGTVRVRAAGAGEADLVAQLVLELLDELAAPVESGYEPSDVRATAAALLAPRGRGWAFIAETNGNAVGVITICECAAIYAGGRFGEITELFVRPAFRSARVGERLIDAAVGLANAQGWTRLEVGAPLGSKWMRSAEFYRRVGFVDIGPRLKRELR